MFKKSTWLMISLLMIASMLLASCATPTAAPAATQPPAPTAAPAATAGPFVIGMLYVGPYNDKGWSQAHYDAAQYVLSKLPGTKLVYADLANPSSRRSSAC